MAPEMHITSVQQLAPCIPARSKPSHAWSHARSPHLQAYLSAFKQLGGKVCHFASETRARQSGSTAAEARGDGGPNNAVASLSENSTMEESEDQTRSAAVLEADTELFLAMKTKLNFKYPRARKLLLLFWGMANLTPGTKASLPADELFETYCQSTTAAQRVPQADFVSELIKAMALLNIVPKQVLVGNQQLLKGIAWSQDTQQDTTATRSVGAGFEGLRATLESSPADRATQVVDQPLVESSPKTTKRSKLRRKHV
ncbi:hypothetical protein WJX79_002725 [Trebouxia sp. C0005]